MAPIENYEENVATSNGILRKNVVEHDVVRRRVSERLKHQLKQHCGKEKKKSSMSESEDNHSIRKRTKPLNDTFVKTRAFIKTYERGITNIRFRLLDCEEDKNKNSSNNLLESNKVNIEKRIPASRGSSENPSKKPQRVATKGNKVHLAKGGKSRKPSSHSYLVCKDLSHGLEPNPIPVFNEVDDAPITPTGFTYITSTLVGKNIQVPPSNGYGCRCKGANCKLSRACSCVGLNNKLAYTTLRGRGRLIKAKDIVFECGTNCGCPPDCFNRVSQKGLQYHLEVFRTPNKGWAVRTRSFIPFGALVCELVGVLKRNEDLENVTNNEYITEIDCWETIKGLDGREKRLPNEQLPENIFHEKEEDKTRGNEPVFCIDSSTFGNVGRFINHSCDPNLFIQCILDSHYGVRQARLVLYAGKYIRPNQELTYDYGYQLNSVVDADGNIKQLSCYCGEATCRGRLY